MLLLDYSAKKEQMLQDYCAQLEPQIPTDAPWENAHTWTMLTGEVEVLIRDTIQLYHDLVRTDELHHYCAVTQPHYTYDHIETQLERLFTNLHTLLEKEIALAAQLARYGHAPQGHAALLECLHAVTVLLADESPIYRTAAFQEVLHQSLEEVHTGRVTEMPQEQV